MRCHSKDASKSLEMSVAPPLALPSLPRRLVLYLTLGYPNWETFYRVLSLIEEAGWGAWR